MTDPICRAENTAYVTQQLAAARHRLAVDDIDGAIELLLSGADVVNRADLELRRRHMALLLTCFARTGRIVEGISEAERYFQTDPIGTVDSSAKTRVVLNYAAVLAGSAQYGSALSVLRDLIVAARTGNIDAADVARAEAMLETLQTGLDRTHLPMTPITGSLPAAYLGTAMTARSVTESEWAKAVDVARQVLDHLPLDAPRRLRLTALSNLGVSLGGAGLDDDALDQFRTAYAEARAFLRPEDPLLHLIQINLGFQLVSVRRYRDAVDILGDLYELQVAVFGLTDPRTEVTMELLRRAREELG